MGCNSSQTAPAWVLFTGCSPSGMDCSSVCPPKVHRSCQKTRFCMGSCPQAAVSAKSLIQHGFSTGCSFLQGTSPGLVWCPPQAAGWISTPPCSSMGCKGTTCITTVFITGCRRISSLAPGEPSPPPSFLTLVSAGLCLSHFFTFFLLAAMQRLSPSCKYVVTDVLPVSLTGSALASGRSILEPAGIDTVQHGDSF